ncbi:MAG TPA: hypothetical protein VFV05_16765 [Methylomirabilota bacterium]|nr:hypothetical protein [Methylomirabilota bacterium]
MARKRSKPKPKPITLKLTAAQRKALPARGEFELRARISGGRLVISRGRKAGSRRRFAPTNSPFA